MKRLLIVTTAFLLLALPNFARAEMISFTQGTTKVESYPPPG